MQLQSVSIIFSARMKDAGCRVKVRPETAGADGPSFFCVCVFKPFFQKILTNTSLLEDFKKMDLLLGAAPRSNVSEPSSLPTSASMQSWWWRGNQLGANCIDAKHGATIIRAMLGAKIDGAELLFSNLWSLFGHFKYWFMFRFKS
jgi:hypothetical protein